MEGVNCFIDVQKSTEHTEYLQEHILCRMTTPNFLVKTSQIQLHQLQEIVKTFRFLCKKMSPELK